MRGKAGAAATTAGIVSVVLFSLVSAYVFGREYSDGTAKCVVWLADGRAHHGGFPRRRGAQAARVLGDPRGGLRGGMGLGATGWGKWFPWSIVPLFAGIAGPRTETLVPGSLVVVALTCATGVAATIWLFTYADNNQ